MSSDEFTLRVLTDADEDQVFDLDVLAFGDEPTSDQARAMYAELIEIGNGRSTGVFDGDELAGVGVVSGMEVTVPGGMLPMAAVNLIAVKPTHRRRGIMRTLIGDQLRTLHEAGLEPLAGLTASEATIYGRFGYGTATYAANFTVPRDRSGLRPVAGIDEVRIRLIPTEDSVDTCAAIHSRQVGTRTGMLTLPPVWARAAATEVEAWRAGRSVMRTAVAERGGEVVGYARYRTKNETGPSGLPTGMTDVHEMHADDAAAFAALVRFLVSIDLMAGTKFRRRPVDSRLSHLLADYRAADVHVYDALYLRLADLDRALAGRTYSRPVDVVLQVSDDLCPWNAGRWRLSGDEKTASCVRSDDAPDLGLDVRELAAVYLGGTTLAALGHAGLVTEHRPGALTDVSRAFATDLAPWLQFGI